MTSTLLLDEVKDVVATSLGIQDRIATVEASTPLLGSIPELDSMAVIELVMAIEKRFDLTFEDEDMTGDVFDTFGSLAHFVAERAA